jgi:hypothetical protein
LEVPVVDVVALVVVEVVPVVDVTVVDVVPEVSLIVPAGIVEVDVVLEVSVDIVPIVEPVSVAIVEEVSVAAAAVSVLLLFVSLLQAKPNTLRARTVRRTRSFLLICFFLSLLVCCGFVRGLKSDERVPAHPPWQSIESFHEAGCFATLV